MFIKKNSATAPDWEIFVIFDSKSRSYGNPVFEVNKDVLLREVINMMNNPEQAKAPHIVNAEDYSIFRIGTYSRSEGKITTLNQEHVANMHDLRALSNWKSPFTAPLQSVPNQQAGFQQGIVPT